ncbi:shikimate kinase [Akkermansiaceae bacterium]|nr:shikimate kinase [Akkermansiaceae bacterium]
MEPNHSNKPKNMHNIVLIGFMGCGKSTIGRELKKSLGYHFIDTDNVIEEQAGKSIPEIFEQNGEQAFRDLETKVLKEIIHQETNHHIIATGGGMPIRPENQALLQKLGFVVWLSCSPEKILARTARTSNRPLLNCNDPLAKISELLEERSPIYESSSHMKINTSSLDFNEISCGILESARYHFGNIPSVSTSLNE